MQAALEVPYQEVEEGLVAVQLQFFEHGQPSKIDDLTKLESVDEKELRQKVAEIGGDIDKAICHEINDLYGSESILSKDVAKKDILGVTFILFQLFILILYLPSHVSICSYITCNSISSLCLYYNLWLPTRLRQPCS